MGLFFVFFSGSFAAANPDDHFANHSLQQQLVQGAYNLLDDDNADDNVDRPLLDHMPSPRKLRIATNDKNMSICVC